MAGLNLGLPGAFGAAGAAEGLDQVLARRMAERQYRDRLAQQEWENQFRQRQLDESMALRKQGQENDLFNRQMNQSHQIVSELSPNQSISPETGRILSATGRGDLVKENPPPAGQGFILSGSQDWQPGSQPGMIFTGTAGQRDQLADNTRADVVAQANERYRAGEPERKFQEFKTQYDYELAHPKPKEDTFADWQKKYDYELANPKAGAAGQVGLQRARAQSAIGMLDHLQQVHAQLQSGEGPGQIARGISAATGGRINLNNAATEYQKIRKATAVALAVAIQGSRPSDADAEAMAQLLPDFTTPASVASNLFAATKQQLADTMAAMGGSAPKPPQGAPATAPSGPAQRRPIPGGGGAMVKMTAPDGRALSVPAEKVAELEALGAKRVQ